MLSLRRDENVGSSYDRLRRGHDLDVLGTDFDHLTIIVIEKHEVWVCLWECTLWVLLFWVWDVCAHWPIICVCISQHWYSWFELSSFVGWVYLWVSVRSDASFRSFGCEWSDEIDFLTLVRILLLCFRVLNVRNKYLKIRDLVLRNIGWHCFRSCWLTLNRLLDNWFSRRFWRRKMNDSCWGIFLVVQRFWDFSIRSFLFIWLDRWICFLRRLIDCFFYSFVKSNWVLYFLSLNLNRM